MEYRTNLGLVLSTMESILKANGLDVSDLELELGLQKANSYVRKMTLSSLRETFDFKNVRGTFKPNKTKKSAIYFYNVLPDEEQGYSLNVLYRGENINHVIMYDGYEKRFKLGITRYVGVLGLESKEAKDYLDNELGERFLRRELAYQFKNNIRNQRGVNSFEDIDYEELIYLGKIVYYPDISNSLCKAELETSLCRD